MKNPSPSILIVGKKGILNWQEDIWDAFIRLGCRCTIFYVNSGSLQEWIEKKRFGAIPFHSAPFKKRFQECVISSSPQIILFLGMIVIPKNFMDFINAITSDGTIKTGWMPDCIKQVPDSDYSIFDTIFYFDSYLQPLLQKIYKNKNKMIFLPLAVNEKTYFDQKKNRKDRLLFAGTCTDARLKLLDTLSKRIPLDIIGPGCKNLLGKRYGFRLSSEKLNKQFNSYAAALNINQKPNTMHGLNFRSFEAAAAGSVVFNENVADLPGIFEPDKEVVVYQSVEELIEKFAGISENKPLKDKITKGGLRRTLSEHTFVHRARSILQHLGFSIN